MTFIFLMPVELTALAPLEATTQGREERSRRFLGKSRKQPPQISCSRCKPGRFFEHRSPDLPCPGTRAVLLAACPNSTNRRLPPS